MLHIILSLSPVVTGVVIVRIIAGVWTEENCYLWGSGDGDLNICFQVGNAEVLNLEDRGEMPGDGGYSSYRYNRATQWQPQSIDGETHLTHNSHFTIIAQ